MSLVRREEICRKEEDELRDDELRNENKLNSGPIGRTCENSQSSNHFEERPKNALGVTGATSFGATFPDGFCLGVHDRYRDIYDVFCEI
ncbi:MAG: hypothetical protein GY822_01655 [Deltaproteobacteria bacterium]|nr:hypothetical protein [Deltaproteobacteria bacterium]